MFCIQVMTWQGRPAEVKKSFMVGEPRTGENRKPPYLGTVGCLVPKRVEFLAGSLQALQSHQARHAQWGFMQAIAFLMLFLIPEGFENYCMLEGVRWLVPKLVWNWQLMVGLSGKEGILTKTWSLVEQSACRCQAQPSSDSSNSGTGQGYRNHGESGS